MQRSTTELAALYNALVIIDSHKDRDCHWNITQSWSYGNFADFRLTHQGYIYKNVDETYFTYEDALAALNAHLQIAINEQLEYAKQVIDHPDDSFGYTDFDLQTAHKKLAIADSFFKE